MSSQRPRVRTSGILVTHRKVRVTNYENGRKRTKWVNVPLVRPSRANTKAKDSDSASQRSNGNILTTRPSLDNVLDNSVSADENMIYRSMLAANGRTYSENRLARSQAWETILDPLQNAYLASSVPVTQTCSLCQHNVFNITLCQDCGPTAYFCPECCLKQHQRAPLHVPLIWKDYAYVPFKFPKKLFMPAHCCNGRPIPSDVTIFDEHGRQHEVDVQFCSCTDKACTLLQLQLWPSTPTNPTIAIHLRLMELCRLMLLEGSMAINKFASTVTMSAAAYESNPPKKDLYRSLSNDSAAYHRRWSYNLSNLQGVVQAFPDGTECPICSQTTEFLPKIVSMDGNFRLVRRVKAGTSDFPPHHDNRFFLPQRDVDPFLHLQTAAHDQSCSHFKAGDESRSNFTSKKLDVTGVFGSICRHDQPQYFIDMTSGEKYGYAVSIIQKLLQEDDKREIKIMYDIACRLLPQVKKAKLDCSRVSLAVPLFHGYAHIMKCQTLYNPKTTPGYGLADGENAERLWSYMGDFAYITREMTPSNRRDLLVDALLHWSQKCLRAAVPKLLKRLQHSKDVKVNAEAEIKVLTSTLQELGVEASHVKADQWQKDLRAQYDPKTRRIQGPTWQEDYATLLNKWFSMRWRIVDVPLTDDEAEAKAELKRLQDELQDIERDHKIQRWAAGSDVYKEAIKKVQDRRENEVLQKLLFQSTERKQHVIKKTRARCQSAAAKSAVQIKKANGRITRLVYQYNQLSRGADITVETAKDPTSPIFTESHLSLIVPYPSCIEVIMNFNIIDRAEEEAESIRIEMQCLLRWYKQVHSLLENSVTLISPPANVAQQGKISLLLVRLVVNEKYQCQLTEVMELKFGIDEKPDKHYKEIKIFKHMSNVLPLTLEEPEVNEYVEAFSDDELPTDDEY